MALASFTLAGLTGAGLRFGLQYGFPWALNYADVRHAHSHLMFFAWVTPAAMLLAGQALADRGRRLPGGATVAMARSEERRVGKEWRSRWSAGHSRTIDASM